MAYLLPINGLFHLKPEAKEEFLVSIQREARLPQSVTNLILVLMNSDAACHPVLSRMAEMFPSACIVENPEPPVAKPTCDYTVVLNGLIQHMLAMATYDRSDRLFPADPKLFATNPLSLAHGAAGSAYALKKITGSVPQQVINWILARPISRETYAPGLYMGISGIAWAILEAGELSRAERLFQITFQHRLLEQSVDLFHGVAGWGMTNLRFFLETGNELYLHNAIGCGNRLLEKSDPVSVQRFWERADRPLGLAHGASGVALYLLYLYRITGQERFVAVGKKALASDIAAGVKTPDGGLSWAAASDAQTTVYPYWRYGSAGIGTVIARYYNVLGDHSYRQLLEKVFIDCDRKYAVLPGRFVGLAGLGDFLLDAWTITGEQHYFDSAHKVAEGLMKFAVDRQGLAFPGDFLSRLCCDYGTGSAGIGLFLNRLLARQGADFLLDDLLNPRQTSPTDAVLSAHSAKPASNAADQTYGGDTSRPGRRPMKLEPQGSQEKIVPCFQEKSAVETVSSE